MQILKLVNSENFNPSLFVLFTLAVLLRGGPRYDQDFCQVGFYVCVRRSSLAETVSNSPLMLLLERDGLVFHLENRGAINTAAPRRVRAPKQPEPPEFYPLYYRCSFLLFSCLLLLFSCCYSFRSVKACRHPSLCIDLHLYPSLCVCIGVSAHAHV